MRRDTRLTRRRLLTALPPLLGLLAGAAARGAPAPAHRPDRPRPAPAGPAATPGAYTLHLSGQAYRVLLHADGSYEASGPHGSRWVGTWGWDARTRTLLVEERAWSDPCGAAGGDPLRLAVRMAPGCLSGRTPSGIEARLERDVGRGGRR